MTDADVTEPAFQRSGAVTPVPYRSGFVAVVGRPNVGKSTLINALIGTQIAIASSRPETTRKAIRGILTTDNAQIVLVDTPGIHRPRTLLGQRLNDVVEESLSDVDAVAFLLPADQEILPIMPGALHISAQTGAGIDRLLAAIAKELRKAEQEMTLLVPFAQYGVINELRQKGRVLSEDYEDTGTRVTVMLPQDAAGQIAARYGDMIQV